MSLFILQNAEKTLLNEIDDRHKKQKDIAQTFAEALITQEQTEQKIDWSKINQAIVSRWSISGLERIKHLAYKIIAKDWRTS